jgi:hypothetical protein
MRTSNPDRLTAATAEQLLDGGPGPAGLSRLLAAAAGPGTASDLAGEAAAVAAFVDAPRTTPLPSAPVRKPSILSTALSKILAAKVLAAVVLLAGAGGGVALAANASRSSSPTDDTSVTSTETAEPGPTSDAAVAPDAGGKAAVPSPEPSIAGLCEAWAADDPGEAAENPAFRSLVEAAGSEEDIPDFCADRERTDRPGRSGEASDDESEDADGAAEPEGRGTPPTAAPGNPDHPAGPPADRAPRGGADADAESTTSDSTKTKGKDTGAEDAGSRDTGSRTTDREDDPENGKASTKEGGQKGGKSEGHRQSD